MSPSPATAARERYNNLMHNAETIVRYARAAGEKDPDRAISRFQDAVRKGGCAEDVRILAEDSAPVRESSAARRSRDADRDFSAELARLVTEAGAKAENAQEFIDLIKEELGEDDPLDSIRGGSGAAASGAGWRSFQSAMAGWARRAGVDAEGAADAAGRAAERYARRHQPKRNARPRRNQKHRRRPR